MKTTAGDGIRHHGTRLATNVEIGTLATATPPTTAARGSIDVPPPAPPQDGDDRRPQGECRGEPAGHLWADRPHRRGAGLERDTVGHPLGGGPCPADRR